jgi:hypothetical protein
MATTWNPSDKGAAVSLSGGNLVATGNSAGVYGTVRSTTSKPSGKWYFEITFAFSTDIADAGGGFANASASKTNYLGGDSHGVGAYSYSSGTGSRLWTNNASFFDPGTQILSGAVIGFALDLDNKLVWYRSGAGIWNNNATYAPGGSGGVDISAFVADGLPAFIACTTNQTDHVLTLNPGPNFANPAPAGFMPWDISIVRLKRIMRGVSRGTGRGRH